MAVTIKIDTGAGLASRNSDYDYSRGACRIRQATGRTVQATFTLVATSPTEYSRGDDVQITDTDGTTTLFNGTIERVTRQAILATEGHIALSMICYGDEAKIDRVFISRRFTSKTCSQIITTLNTDYGLGLTLTGVEAGATIDEIAFSERTFRQVLDMLAERSKGFTWHISAASVLTFADAANASAGAFNLTDSPSNKPYDPRTLTVMAVPNEYYNFVKVYGYAGKQQKITESVAFPQGQGNWSPTHLVAGGGDPASSGDLGVEDVTGGGSTLYNLRSKGDVDDTAAASHFLFDPSTRAVAKNTTLGAGNRTLEFTYEPKHRAIDAYKDAEGIAAYGLFEAPPISDDSIRTIEAAHERARAFLYQHQDYEIDRVTFDTDTESAGGLLSAGEAITITLSSLGLSGTFVVESATYDDYRADGTQWLQRVVCYKTRLPVPPKRALDNAARSKAIADGPETFVSEHMEIATETEVVSATFANTLTEV